MIGAIKGFVSALWRGVTRIAHLLGRVTSRIARMVVTAVGHVSPAAADALYAAFVTTGSTITGIAERINTAVTTAGEVMWMLANTTVVRTVSTVMAGPGAAILVVHEATSGTLAAGQRAASSPTIHHLGHEPVVDAGHYCRQHPHRREIHLRPAAGGHNGR